MATDYYPVVDAEIADVASQFGIALQPPHIWHTTAPDWHTGSGWQDDGRYHAPRGELQGASNADLADTTLVTGANIGATFDVISGNWIDNWSGAPQTYTTGIYKSDASAAVQWEVVQHDKSGFIVPAIVQLFLGWVGPFAAAQIIAAVSGGVLTAVTVSDGGTGYPPSSTFAGVVTGVGTAAKVTVTTDADGVVLSCAITAGGSGYTDVPQITIARGSGAKGVVDINGAPAAFSTFGSPISDITYIAGGSGYPISSSFQIPVIGSGTGAVVTATTDAMGTITSFAVTNGGADYSPSPTFLQTGFRTANTGATNNAYLHFCYGGPPGTADYRISLNLRKPVRLEYAADGVTFVPVSSNKFMPSLDEILKTDDNTLTFRVLPNYTSQTLDIEINGGKYVIHAPGSDQTGQNIGLPMFGCVRFVGVSRAVGMHYWPIESDPVTIGSPTYDFGEPLQNATEAFGIFNGTAYQPSDQQTTVNVTTDDDQNFQFQAIAYSATNIPVLSDVAVVVPANWALSVPGVDPSFQYGPVPLRHILTEHTEFIDQIRLTGGISGQVKVNNYDSYYSGSFGHAAFSLDASNGVEIGRMCTGYAGVGAGVGFGSRDPDLIMTLPLRDKSRAMEETTGEEFLFDGWYLGSVILFLLDKGNCYWPYFASGGIYDQNPGPYSLLSYLYVPPGTTPGAPYGPAGDDIADGAWVLPKGTGLNPRYHYTPEMTPWSILLQLVQEIVAYDPWTGLPVPYFMWFDAYGIFHFEPVFFSQVAPSFAYGDFDQTGLGQISNLQLYNSIESMRTWIEFQGLNAQTNDNIRSRLQLSPSVLATVGWQSIWMERNARWCTQAYLDQMVQAGSFQASLPQQVAVWEAAFQPNVHAGDVVLLTSSPDGIFNEPYRIDEIASIYGFMTSGGAAQMVCESTITARPLLNAL